MKRSAKEQDGITHGRSVFLKLASLLFLVAVLLYGNTVRNGFVADDGPLIVNDTLVTRGVTSIPNLFVMPYRRGFREDRNDQYRPLSLVMFAIEYPLFGKKPQLMHLMNVLLFGGCVVSLFLFIHWFFGGRRRRLAFVCALLFALHPVHTEVVANIKSRDELLCFLFAFVSLNCFMRYAQKGDAKALACGAASFLLSFLAKETAVSLALLVPLIFFVYRPASYQRNVAISIAVWIVTGLVLAIRFTVLGHYDAGNIAETGMMDNVLASPGITVVQRIATTILIMGYYLRLLVAPYPLNWDYSFNAVPVTDLAEPWVWVSLAACVVLVAIAIARFRQQRNDIYAFCIIFFLITIGLFSNLFFLVGVTVAERFLFLPSVGFCLALALLLDQKRTVVEEKGTSRATRPVLWISLAVIGIAYATIAVQRNTEWRSNYTLYLADVQKAPNSARTNYLLGNELVRMADTTRNTALATQVRCEGITYLTRAASIFPGCPGIENVLAYAYLSNHNYDSAELHATIAMKSDTANRTLAANLAGIYMMRGSYRKATDAYLRLVNMPGAPDVAAFADLGICYGNLEKYDSSVFYCRKAIALAPANPVGYNVIITTFSRAGKTDSATAYTDLMADRVP